MCLRMKFYKICSQCDYFCREEENDKFCPFCGNKLIDKCLKCGESIDNPYALFCKNCGQKYRKANEGNNSKNFQF